MILLDPLARPVIAHRGASGHYPENTLLAFRQAIDAGAGAFELDVRMTGDGVPVVLHDEDVDRTTDGSGPVAGMSLESLRELDAGEGERVPRLADVLEAFPETAMIIELKSRDAGPAVVDLIHTSGARGRVLLAGFRHRAVGAARWAGLPTSASRPETALFWTLSRLGVSLPVRCKAFTVPEHSGRLRVVDPRFVGCARRRGWPVHVWTVDTAAKAEKLWAMGVAGIITNFPDRLCRLPSGKRE